MSCGHEICEECQQTWYTKQVKTSCPICTLELHEEDIVRILNVHIHTVLHKFQLQYGNANPRALQLISTVWLKCMQHFFHKLPQLLTGFRTLVYDREIHVVYGHTPLIHQDMVFQLQSVFCTVTPNWYVVSSKASQKKGTYFMIFTDTRVPRLEFRYPIIQYNGLQCRPKTKNPGRGRDTPALDSIAMDIVQPSITNETLD